MVDQFYKHLAPNGANLTQSPPFKINPLVAENRLAYYGRLAVANSGRCRLRQQMDH